MTKEDRFEILAYLLTQGLLEVFPLDRQTIRSHVYSALHTLDAGLLNATVAGMTGEINETTALYSIRIP